MENAKRENAGGPPVTAAAPLLTASGPVLTTSGSPLTASVPPVTAGGPPLSAGAASPAADRPAQQNTLLKFITCGSVDDGKSTLIGHILYDAKLLYADQAQALELDSRTGSRGGKIDYSLLLDGLLAEREQGITIDVAYRYFTTERRSFIVADTPGHEEYTRNMAVGASFADLAVILVDAAKGVVVQTRRHARICALMGISHFVFAVNKMDLAGYDRETFQTIRRQIEALQTELSLGNVKIIPVSATEGDNVTAVSDRMPWYDGGALLSYLETVQIETDRREEGFYLPIQRVCRPDRTFRGFQGQIEAGQLSVEDSVMVLPSGTRARVKRLFAGDRSVETAVTGQAVTVELDREIDVSRGCVLVKGTQIYPVSRFEATILWMDDGPLDGSRSLFVKLGTQTVPGRIGRLAYVVDVNTGAYRTGETLGKNGIARCEVELSRPVAADTFSSHRTLGEFILIDRLTNATSACGVIEKVYAARETGRRDITPERRAALLGQTPYLILTDTPSAASNVERELSEAGLHTMLVEAFPADADAGPTDPEAVQRTAGVDTGPMDVAAGQRTTDGDAGPMDAAAGQRTTDGDAGPMDAAAGQRTTDGDAGPMDAAAGQRTTDVDAAATGRDSGGDRAVFAAELLRDAGLIAVFSCQGLDPETVERLAGVTRPAWLLDLRDGGPKQDRLTYENTVRYSFF